MSAAGVGSSPSGPKGPVPSSRDSKRVGCSSTRRGVRGVRGPRPAGDRGGFEAERLAGVDFTFCESGKKVQHVLFQLPIVFAHQVLRFLKLWIGLVGSLERVRLDWINIAG